MTTTVPPIDPSNEESGEGQTSFDLAYSDISKVTTTEKGSEVALFGENHRKPIKFIGKVRDPLLFREAMSTLYAVVSSDYRYKPKDKAAYAAYLRMKRETSHLGVWQAQQAYFSWLQRNDPLAAFILDPIITVHPDRMLFEVFSKDESSYASLSLDHSLFQPEDKVVHGTTNIDFSQSLYDGVQQMRSYRETVLSIGGGGVKVATAGTTGVLEKKIRVPDSWLRGFLQVASAATLPMDSFRLAPIDLYNVLRYLRMHADIKGKRRGLRVELIPGESPRLVLEPWEQLVPCTGEPYKGKAARVIRVWGRRRLSLLKRILPNLASCEVYLLGSGLPSFWVFGSKGFTLTVGLSGFTAANWSQSLNFDLLLPRKTLADAKPLEKVIEFLGKGTFVATADVIAKEVGLKGAALLETLQAGCQQGKLMFDLSQKSYRLRPLTETPLDLVRLEYRNQRERIAHDLLTRKGGVKITTENRIPGTGLELTGQVSVAEDRRDYRPVLLLGEEGQVVKAECTCPLFRKQGLKAGPCAHLIALRLAYAKQEAEKAKGVDPRQVIQVETRTYTRRDEKGEEVYQVSLLRRKVNVRWGRTGQPQRVQTLLFNNIEDARTAYFDRISDLDDRGFLNMTGE